MGGIAAGKKKLRYVPPTVVDRKPVVHLDSKKFEKVHMNYERLVIGGFVGRRLPFQYIKEFYEELLEIEK